MTAGLLLEDFRLRGSRVKRKKGHIAIVAMTWEGTDGVPSPPDALPIARFSKPRSESWRPPEEFRLLLRSYKEAPTAVGWAITYVVLGNAEEAEKLIKQIGSVAEKIPVVGDVIAVAASIGEAIASIVGGDKVLGTDASALMGPQVNDDYSHTVKLYGVESTVHWDVVDDAGIAWTKSVNAGMQDADLHSVLAGIDFDTEDPTVNNAIVWVPTNAMETTWTP